MFNFKHVKKILPVIGIALFIYLLARVGIRPILKTLATVNINYLIIAILLSVFFVFLQSWKWYVIMKRQGIKVNYLYALKIQFISMFYGAITPSRAGSFIKVFYIKHKTKKLLGECISSVLLERILDLIIVFLFALAGTILLINYFTNLFWEVLIALIIILVGILVFMNKKLGKRFGKMFIKFLIPKKFKKDAINTVDGFYDTLLKPTRLIKPFLIALLAWFTSYTQLYLVGIALNIHIPYFYFITMVSISTVISLIPITIGGLGTRELTLITLFSVFAVTQKQVLAMSLVGLFISIALSAIGGLLILKEEKYL